ncbi:MAG: family 10 glycosylhydrolase [Cytophagales bacterium]|nr:family 10 glycosylhydrolase [Armatimonadota bacterium]
MPIHPAARWLAAPVGAALTCGVAAATFAPVPSAAKFQEFSAPVPIAPPVPLAVPAMKRGEVRAMWVVRDSMTSPQKIRNAVALAKKHHFNTLFVQVRGRGDAFYHSRFEPRSEELTGTPREFDPLAVAVSEGHKAGLEVHAWKNTFLVWHKGRRPYSQQHVVNRHSEWLVQDRNEHITLTEKKDCEGAFLDPALPGVREHTKNVFLDVATRYDVDGIHFDYVRFPSDAYSFSRADLLAFRSWLIPQVSQNEIEYADAKSRGNRMAWYHLYQNRWKEWRQSVVTQTVREIAEAAHLAKPRLIVSAAVFPNHSVASRDKGQLWHHWLQAGIIDAACPMTYNRSTGLVGKQIRAAVAASGGRPIIGGVGAWQMSAGSAIAKGQLYRALGAGGVNFFSYDGMTRYGRTEAYLAKISGSLFPSPALPPNWRRPATLSAAAPAIVTGETESPVSSGE